MSLNNSAGSVFIPTVIERSDLETRAYDIYSRLLKDRIVFLGDQVGSASANSIIAQFLFLEQQDDSSDIFLYINSPGGSVDDGLAIFDTMNYIKPDVSTICLGACSMATVLLANGAAGKRFILPNSRVMIHQPSTSTGRVKASDLEIHYQEIKKIEDLINKILAKKTGQKLEKVKQDTKLGDYWLSAEEAVKYGLVDKIIKKRPK